MSTRPRRGDSAEPVGLLGLANGRPSGGEFGGRWRIRLDYPYLSKSLNGEGGIRTLSTVTRTTVFEFQVFMLARAVP